MIKVTYLYKSAEGWKSCQTIFYDRTKALKFMYATKHKFKCFEWICDDPEDNRYLYTRFKA